MKPTDVLRTEHEVILDVLAALETIHRAARRDGKLDLRSAEDALDFLAAFADRCHHGKEEQLLFAALIAHGLPSAVGPLAVLSSEHDQGRALIARMSKALADAKASRPDAAARFAEAGDTYVALMRDHIAKENGVLFPVSEGMLTAQEQAELMTRFESFEHEDMEAGAHQRFLDLASGLCERLDVTRTATATAGHTCCGHAAACH
jgi:hemerythrin-like domain-containing protein